MKAVASLFTGACEGAIPDARENVFATEGSLLFKACQSLQESGWPSTAAQGPCSVRLSMSAATGRYRVVCRSLLVSQGAK